MVAGSTIIVIVEVVVEQVFTLVIRHCKMFVPRLRPVTALVGLLGVVTTPVPPNTLQLPVPTTAALPARVVLGLLIQIVWLGPAFAFVVAGSTITVIDELVEEQVFALVMFH